MGVETGKGIGSGTGPGAGPPEGVPGEAPGPAVPGFTVVRELGRGGSSTVWLVQDDGGREAALKVPDRRAETPAELLDVELRAVGELRHDHVVRLLGVVQTDAGPGLLSEYHPGGSLGTLVREAGPVPLGQVVTVLVPVAQALQALHEHGVVHGDVSPGNILFTLSGRPAVADLGSSRLLGGPGVRAGTPGFSAPELDGVHGDGDDAADGEGTGGLAPAADVYSLAAVGWYALTGRAPARTSSRAPLPLVVPDIPGDVVTLLEAGLDEDPVARPGAAEFARACYRWAEPEPVDLYPSASREVARELPTRRRPGTAARTRTRRRPLRWAAGVVLVLALGAGTVLAAGALSPVEGPTPPPAGSTPAAVDGTSATAAHPSAPAPTRVDPTDADPTGTGPDGTAPDGLAEAVKAIGASRTAALAALDTDLVADYAVPGSEAHGADVALIGELLHNRVRFDGLTLGSEVSGQVEETGPDRARAPVTLSMSPYRTVAVSGEVLAETADATSEHVIAVLVRTPQGWLVERLLPGRPPDDPPEGG